MTYIIQRVAVIGAGTMGGGIAAHFANAGYQVDLLDIPADVLTAALVPLGYPVEPFPKKLARRPLSEICFGDAWGEPAFR